MKNNFLKFLFFALAGIVMFSACKKEENQVIYDGNASGVTLTANKSTVVLVKETADDVAMTFNWTNPGYSFNTGISSQDVTYTLEMAVAGTNFAEVASKVVIGDLSTSLTHGELNQMLTSLDLVPGVPQDVEARVIARLGQSEVTKVVSNVISFNATTYSDVTISYLHVPGEYQGWNPAAAPLVWSTNNEIYEGYVWVPGGGTRKFKFTSAPNWGGINYGDAGPGALSTDGGASDLTLPASATDQMYKLTANTGSLTWSAVATTWGLIGSATPGGWDTDTPLNYDPATGLYTATVTLTAGEIKFRANSDWGINLGASLAGEGYLDYGGDNIQVPSAGQYLVTLDLRAPTANTPPTPFKYKYILQPL